MARPEEKANAMMNKWVKMREAGNAPAKRSNAKRPHLASECSSLADAERFRRQLLREITELISKIQNPGAGEHVLRDLNDEINRKMREKHHWNLRIKQLGGADFHKVELKQQLENASANDSILGSGGYRYYGAAKDLPGVRELFERLALQKQKKRHRSHVFKRITPDYYGWREEEDGVLLELEEKASAAFNEEAAKELRLETQHEEEDDDEEDFYYQGGVVEPPSQELIQEALLERKKKELLERFAY